MIYPAYLSILATSSWYALLLNVINSIFSGFCFDNDGADKNYVAQVVATLGMLFFYLIFMLFK